MSVNVVVIGGIAEEAPRSGDIGGDEVGLSGGPYGAGALSR